MRANAFRYDRRLTIQTATVARNDLGEAVKTWATYTEVWARRMPQRGHELYAAQQVVPQAENRYRVRWRGDLNESMRFVDDDVTYGIQHIAEIGRRDELEITAQKPE
ncbi:MAG TPA: phage head closure protein [Burkholderiales bacterium]